MREFVYLMESMYNYVCSGPYIHAHKTYREFIVVTTKEATLT